MDFATLLDRELADVRDMLIAKNTAYGNSALDPVRIFSKADAIEQIKVRLDDKISRLQRGSNAGEDVETDLLGYLFLLRIARRIAVDNLDAVTSAVLPAFLAVGGPIGADVALDANQQKDQSREPLDACLRQDRDAAFPSPSPEGKNAREKQ
jgi:hypothetical protein